MRTAWAVGGGVVLGVILRALNLGTPLGRDEYIARHWPAGHGLPCLVLASEARGITAGALAVALAACVTG